MMPFCLPRLRLHGLRPSTQYFFDLLNAGYSQEVAQASAWPISTNSIRVSHNSLAIVTNATRSCLGYSTRVMSKTASEDWHISVLTFPVVTFLDNSEFGVRILKRAAAVAAGWLVAQRRSSSIQVMSWSYLGISIKNPLSD